jgi:hypothetical protein
MNHEGTKDTKVYRGTEGGGQTLSLTRNSLVVTGHKARPTSISPSWSSCLRGSTSEEKTAGEPASCPGR